MHVLQSPSYSLITYTIFRLPFISALREILSFTMRERYLGGKAVISGKSAKLQQYWRYVQYDVIQVSQTVLRVYS